MNKPISVAESGQLEVPNIGKTKTWKQKAKDSQQSILRRDDVRPKPKR